MYGPYTDIEGGASSELSYHFESHVPFLTVTELVREIEISHWGNVAVTEDITLKHTGAKLKVLVVVVVVVVAVVFVVVLLVVALLPFPVNVAFEPFLTHLREHFPASTINATLPVSAML